MFLISIICFLMIISLNLFLKKKNILLNYSGEEHQNLFNEKSIPLSGGIIIFLFSFFYLNFGILDIIVLSLIFWIGLLSDFKIFKSPKLRIILQLISVLFIVYSFEILIFDTRLDILDSLLKHKLFNLLFVSFCIMIIINGSNFIDGVNNSSIGYYIIILSILLYFENNQILIISFLKVYYLLLILFILIFFNFFNKLYLGDSGSCQLGLIISILLIQLYLENHFISPYYIISLLWYPSFENLFSIFRKLNLSKSPIKADTNHLHQLIFKKIKDKKIFRNEKTLNNVTGLIIIFYNLFVLVISSNYISDSVIQIFIVSINIGVYVTLYFALNSKKNQNI